MHNPTYEFFLPKNINSYNSLQIPSQVCLPATHVSLTCIISEQFMLDTLNSNHFPIIFTLPDGMLFITTTTQAMIFNWHTNVEMHLPDIPNGMCVT